MSDKLFLEIEDFLEGKLQETIKQFGKNVARCERCGLLCKLSPKPGSEARLVKRASRTKGGLCVNCSATSFIKSVETLNYGIENKGPEMLLNEAVQAQFSNVMLAGKADAHPSELNWEAVVKNWDLPFRKSRGKRNAK
jgi:hypothetical protein